LSQRLAQAGLDWIVPAWEAPLHVGALATTRNFGTSPLDIGPARLEKLGDAERAIVQADRDRVHAFLPSPAVYLEQVHGRDVVVVDAVNLEGMRGHPPVADAAVTRLAGVALAVRVADCVPVLFASREGTVVAAAHAGWRGLAAGVLEATVIALRVPPAEVVAWLGPAIGPAAFEVGDDVRDAFTTANADDARHFRHLHAGKWLADLPALASARLARAGVRDVSSDGACTCTDAARFHSWRRDRTTGRMAAYVWRAASSGAPGRDAAATL
jgi:YfiH family protein